MCLWSRSAKLEVRARHECGDKGWLLGQTLLTSDWSLEPFSFFDTDKVSVALYLLTLLICRNNATLILSIHFNSHALTYFLTF